ncbi:MAG: molybdenum cofactor guanylyltransferase [Oxalobacter sp.]|nr:MAG: molybdenum cofactor guanylyltransferase [Oxalobacter sp.]
MFKSNQVSCLILAGGRGVRMENADKGLQQLDGVAMVAHVIRSVAPQAATLMINANRNLEAYRQFGLPVWPDEMEGFAGPLAGIQTGLRHCRTSYMATVPCDTPFLPADLLARLGDALVAQNADIAVAATGTGSQRRIHAVCSLMKTVLLPHLNDYLLDGNRKVQSWLDLLKTVEVFFEDESRFRNINTLEELRQAETLPSTTK